MDCPGICLIAVAFANLSLTLILRIDMKSSEKMNAVEAAKAAAINSDNYPLCYIYDSIRP